MKWLAERILGRAMWFSVGVMALALIEGQASGQSCEHKIFALDGATNDGFGISVSISGTPGNEVAIIGSQFDNDNGLGSGSVFIYRKSGVNWVEEQKILASDGASGDLFGWSVSISGFPGNEIAIVGAYQIIRGAGAAYIYRKRGEFWIEEQKLIASDGAIGDFFGYSVSIIGPPGNEVAIVGAKMDVIDGGEAGSAYIYRFNPDTSEWIEEQKLIAFDDARVRFFGRAVSISGTPRKEVAVVGSSSSAFIYRFNGATWIEEQQFNASGPLGGANFGFSVSISGTPGNEVAIIGAIWEGDLQRNPGSAYIFRKSRGNWYEEAKLFDSDGASGDFFGYSVSIRGVPGNEVAIIGAPRNDDSGTNSGSAYIYRFDGVSWVEEPKLLASDGAPGDWFGLAVSISGTPGNEAVIVGADLGDAIERNSGSAYIYELPCGPACPADLNGDRIVDVFDLFRVIHALFTRGDVAEDLDGDGVVTFRDVHIVIQSFGSCDDSNPESCSADLNGDGIVDVPDLLLLLGSWGSCSTPCPSDLNGDGAVNISDFLQLLAAWGPCP